MKKSNLIGTLLPLGLAVLAGTVLFWTSRGVQQSHHDLTDIRDSVAYEKEAIRVLQAEWSYLNNPERLEALVQKHLEIQMPEPVDMINDIDGLPEHIVPAVPARKPPMFRHAVARPGSVSPSNPTYQRSEAAPPRQPDNLPASSSQNDKGFFSLIDQITDEGRVDE